VFLLVGFYVQPKHAVDNIYSGKVKSVFSTPGA
jgi:hypothetical protein